MTGRKHIDSLELARHARLKALELCYLKKASHLGGALSAADLLAVLYADILAYDPRNPKHDERDRFFYSKGHACTVLYAILEKVGFFTGLGEQFAENGTVFTSHVSHHVPGIELSTGSLGHALSVACGVSLAGQIGHKDWKTYCLISDGELDEGSNWEAILFAAQHKLSKLCLIVDFNKVQSMGAVSDVVELEPLDRKFESFGWNVYRIDGHSHEGIRNRLTEFSQLPHDKPCALVADTVKGNGVSFMENSLLWHYRSPNDEEYQRARSELLGQA